MFLYQTLKTIEALKDQYQMVRQQQTELTHYSTVYYFLYGDLTSDIILGIVLGIVLLFMLVSIVVLSISITWKNL